MTLYVMDTDHLSLFDILPYPDGAFLVGAISH